jgi:putative membrane protein insertion efficiency factor
MIHVGTIADRLGCGILLLLVRAYRLLLSPVLGPACRFAPTCSAYAEEAITRFGAVKGSALAVRRILRCHPFAAAGLDPVPASISKPTRTKTT